MPTNLLRVVDERVAGEIVLRFHGTGAGHPSATRQGSGATLRVEGEPLLLIDAGDSVPRRLLADGVDPCTVGSVILSHWHPDHWCGLPGLVMAWDIAGRSEPATIVLPPGSVDFLRAVLRFSWLEMRPRSYDLNIVEYRTGTGFQSGSADILPLGTSHLSRYHTRGKQEDLSLPAHLFRIRLAGTTFLFSQDIGTESDLVPYLDGVRHVVCEAAHINLQRTIELVRGGGEATLYFTHVAPDRESDLARIAESQDRSNENGGVIVAYDGLGVVIGAEHH